MKVRPQFILLTYDIPVSWMKARRDDGGIESNSSMTLRWIIRRCEVPYNDIPVLSRGKDKPRIARPTTEIISELWFDNCTTHSTLVKALTCPSRQRIGARVSRSHISAEPLGRPAATYRPVGSYLANEAPAMRAV